RALLFAPDLPKALPEALDVLLSLLLLFGRHALAIGHLREFFAVDGPVGAEFHRELRFFLARDDGDGTRAHGVGELRREAAEPAGAAPDEHVLARLELCAIH